MYYFCKQVGLPVYLIVDGHKDQISNKVREFRNQVSTTFRILMQIIPWANRAELYIGLLKEALHKGMRASNPPMCPRDY